MSPSTLRFEGKRVYPFPSLFPIGQCHLKSSLAASEERQTEGQRENPSVEKNRKLLAPTQPLSFHP
jgi:hypothetical protein